MLQRSAIPKQPKTKVLFPTKPKLNLTSTIFKVSEEEILNKEPIANG